MTTTENVFDVVADAPRVSRGSRRDYIDNELIDHEFRYGLNRGLASRFPQLLINFAEDFDQLVSLGATTHELKSLVRQAYLLADGGGENIRALLERLNYRDDIMELHHHKVSEAAQDATRSALNGLSRVQIDDCLDPHGYYVYILWGETEPIYVGQSSNVLNRLGSHMGDPEKRAATKRIQLIRCDDREKMLETELHLIGEYRPILNVNGNPDARR